MLYVKADVICKEIRMPYMVNNLSYFSVTDTKNHTVAGNI
jgi:hypothetical protein